MNDKPIRILRAPHDKENPYVMIRRAVPQNRCLSWAARGVLSYLLSKSDDWVIEPKDLEQGCGRDKVYSVLTEITEAGYLERFQIIGERGRFEDFEYHLHEVPLPAKPDHTYKREDQLNKDSSFAANAAGSNSNSQIAEATQSPMVSSSDYPWYIEGTLWAESEYSLDGAIAKVQELDNLSFSSEDIKAFTAGFNEIRLSAIDSDDRIDADSDPSAGERKDSDVIHGASNPTPSVPPVSPPTKTTPFKTTRPVETFMNKPLTGKAKHVAVNPPQLPASTSKPAKAKKPSIITSIDEINEIDRPLYKFVCSVKCVDPVMDYNDKELQQYTFVLIGAIVNREKAALKITEGVLDLKSRTDIALRLNDPVTGFVAWYSKMSPGMNLPTGKVTFKTNLLKWYDQSTAMISRSEPEFVTITVMSDWGTKIDKSVPRSELHKYTQVER